MENKLTKFIKTLNNLWCKKSGAIIMLIALIVSIIFFILWSINHIPTLLFSIFMVIGISPILSICIYQKFVGRMVRVKNVFNRFNAECKYCICKTSISKNLEVRSFRSFVSIDIQKKLAFRHFELQLKVTISYII